MTNRSKSKGNAWELEVAKFLSATYDASFLRVPSSGAFVGGKNNFRKTTIDQAQLQSKKGDIHPPQEWKYFNIECKSYSDFPFHQLWYADVKILDGWIQQQRDVEDPGDLSLIFIKISRKEKWVVFPDNLGFKVERGLSYKGWVFAEWNQFWGETRNQELVKGYSISSLGADRKISDQSSGQALQTCLL